MGERDDMRAFLVLLCVLVAAPAMGQNQLNGPNGLRLLIDATGHGGLTGPTPFLGWPQLCVRSAQECVQCDDACPDASIYSAGGVNAVETDGGQGLQMATVPLAGLHVSRHVWVPAGGPENADGFFVYYDRFENRTDQEITVSLRLGTVTPGRGRILENNATVWRTHSDDALLEVHDRWFLVDDPDAFGGGPTLAVLTHGAGARQPLSRIGQSFLAKPNSDEKRLNHV